MIDAMMTDEPARLAALHRLQVLDTAPEPAFDKIVTLVRTVLSVPIAAVTLVDQDRQWFKARQGVAVTETPRDASFCTHTIRQREPLVIEDALADPRFANSPLVVSAPHIRSYAGVPLRTAEGYNVGALCAIDTKPRAFSGGEMALLDNFAHLVVDQLELRQIAQRDELTGALTRRGFIEQAGKELARYARYGRNSSLAILDIDHFKAVNDTYGHPTGDAVLRQVADLCSMLLRPNDLLGRIGGEEFVLLLSETGTGEALAAAERFRNAIAAHEFVIDGDRAIAVTASFGIASTGPGITGVDGWLAAADAPLYRAKRDGRNRCYAVPDEPDAVALRA